MTTAHKGTQLSADEALERLMEGNQRFLRGEARGSAFRLESITELAKAQSPYATVLGCSDSRVPPEWIFDTGLGELFVVRVAGNILSPEISGTLQYAGSYLETPLFVVLGHEGCGAVAAALATKHEGTQFRSRVQLLLANILPGLPEFDPTLSPEEQASQAVESNVRWTVRQILDSPEGKARLTEGRVKIVGAVYEVETGRVRFLPSDQTR
jgi:carbonic anhydrase